MAANREVKIVEYIVDKCPKCGEAHTYQLKIILYKIPIFGGGKRETLIEFVCPKTKQKFKKAVADPPDGEIEGLASSSDIKFDQRVSSIANLSLMETEFVEWTKSSRFVALDFCKTMIGISVGAIPVYFAVLKFLGLVTISGKQFGMLLVLPPFAYLVALILFALALRPTFEIMSPQDFPDFRQKRLTQLNWFITAGIIVFIAGTGLAIVAFFYAIFL